MPRETYLIDRTTNEKYCVSGLLPSERLPGKENLRRKFSDHRVIKTEQLPPKVDLRLGMTAIENQAKTKTCVSNSFAGVYEFLLKKTSGRDIDVSRLFIHYNARAKNKNLAKKMKDKGCRISTAIDVLEEHGTCLESIWPFEIEQVNSRPSNEAFEAAQTNRIIDALQVNIDLDEMKACLAQGYPFVFGLKLFKSFSHAAKKGIVPTPTANDVARNAHGSHAMVAVGYSDRSKAFIVRNSWGEKWGFKGYGYIAYDYMANPKYSFDMWTVRQLESDDIGHEYWEEDLVDYLEDDSDVDDENYDIEFNEEEEEEEEEIEEYKQEEIGEIKQEIQEQSEENKQEEEERRDENNQGGEGENQQEEQGGEIENNQEEQEQRDKDIQDE